MKQNYRYTHIYLKWNNNIHSLTHIATIPPEHTQIDNDTVFLPMFKQFLYKFIHEEGKFFFISVLAACLPRLYIIIWIADYVYVQ